jgi:hypothetical protein
MGWLRRPRGGDGGLREGRGQGEEATWVGIFLWRVRLRVVSAGNVPCVYLTEVIGRKEELVDAPKYVVSFCISVPAIPPSLDDTCVVAVDEDTRV